MSIIWSCISASSIEDHAGNIIPVTEVVGFAVCDTKVTPVSEDQDTHVYFIQACVFQRYTCIRHAVTVGAFATIISVSVGLSFALRVLLYQVSKVCILSKIRG